MKSNTLLAAAIAGVVAVSAHAQAATITIYDSNGFDTRFVNGVTLEGQDATQGPWLRTINATPSTAVVQAGVGVGGTAGVTLTTTAGQTDTQYFVTKAIQPTAATPTVNVSWAENVTKTTVSGLQFGPFLGIEAFDTLSTPGTIKQIGSFGVDATTGELLVLKSTTAGAQFDILDSDATVPFSSYSNLGMTLNYTSKTYTVTLNGVALQTFPFVDQTATAFTDADLSSRFVSNPGEQSLSTGTAKFDNYVISMTTVPEPTSLAGLAVIGLIFSKRQR